MENKIKYYVEIKHNNIKSYGKHFKINLNSMKKNKLKIRI